ncbi:hypothetical protein DFH09DRAFT_1085916 [Mycena vulgaris]|nr:hypothetical protein DFH09DRAFT_1085916 [Mycena vulgaris]
MANDEREGGAASGEWGTVNSEWGTGGCERDARRGCETLEHKLGSPETKEHLRNACGTLVIILGTAKDAASNAGIPELATAISSFLLVLSVIEKTYQNADDVEDLSKRLQRLVPVLQNTKRASPAVTDRVLPLATFLDEIYQGTMKMKSGSVVKRSWNFTQDSEWLKRKIHAVTWLIETFTVDTMLQVEFALDVRPVKYPGRAPNIYLQDHVRGFQEFAPAVIGRLERNHEILQELQSASQRVGERSVFADRGQELTLTQGGYPPHAVKATFNWKDWECCSESTRTTILGDIARWIDAGGSSDGRHSRDAKFDIGNPGIFWVNGSAGTGKTTIAYTVARNYKERTPSVLGATFFCSRDDADCSNLRLIFTTIAYQLALFNPQFRTKIFKVLQAQPDIGSASPHYRLEELIVKPLHEVRDSFSRCLVILDALDECKDIATTSTILSALSNYIGELSPLIFLVTSRSENHIQVGLNLDSLQVNTHQLILRQVTLDVVEQDIKHYLSLKLVKTRRTYKIRDPWPAVGSIEVLAKLSSGLFIFAATSIKYIEDPSHRDPRGRLKRLIEAADTVMGESSPYNHLDKLYTKVLELEFPEISPSFLGLLKMVLGSLVHLQDPLCVLELERLLGLSVGRLRETLLDLHAVLIVPEEDNEIIRLLHPSFANFIIDPRRCSISKYVVKLEEQHTLLAQSCLVAMQGLFRDICKIKNPSILNSEVPDLGIRIRTYIPGHVQYAYRHWAHHVSKGMISTHLLDVLKSFCELHLLRWLEVCGETFGMHSWGCMMCTKYSKWDESSTINVALEMMLFKGSTMFDSSGAGLLSAVIGSSNQHGAELGRQRIAGAVLLTAVIGTSNQHGAELGRQRIVGAVPSCCGNSVIQINTGPISVDSVLRAQFFLLRILINGYKYGVLTTFLPEFLLLLYTSRTAQPPVVRSNCARSPQYLVLLA